MKLQQTIDSYKNQYVKEREQMKEIDKFLDDDKLKNRKVLLV